MTTPDPRSGQTPHQVVARGISCGWCHVAVSGAKCGWRRTEAEACLSKLGSEDVEAVDVLADLTVPLCPNRLATDLE